MNRSKRQRGFTLVELLAVIVILGILSTIGIASVTRLIQKSKEEKVNSQKNAIIMAAQSYTQANKQILPKSIGEVVKIPVKDLLNTKYLTEEITNDKGETCMEKSFIRAYKPSKGEVVYTAHIYCGNEPVPDNVVPTPVFKVEFRDGSKKELDSLQGVRSAVAHFEVVAASEKDLADYKDMGTEILIDGYQYSISVESKTDKSIVEVYNSGTLSANNSPNITFDADLNQFVDFTTANKIIVNVSAYNTLGGTIDSTSSLGASSNTATFDDKTPPVCSEDDVVIYDENHWLDKKTYFADKERRQITIRCRDDFEYEDGSHEIGSGCIRDEFTRAWPNDSTDADKKGAEFSTIEIKDNAGNTTVCKRPVYVDVEAPEMTITGYKAKSIITSVESGDLSSQITGSNVLTANAHANDKSSGGVYNYNDYSDSVGHDGKVNWLNLEKYGNGIIYKVELKDNLRLDSWTWKTNAAGLVTSSNGYRTVQSGNPDSSSGFIPQVMGQNGMTDYHGTTSYVIYVRFASEGARYGELELKDKAGNSTKYYLAANLDRTKPPVPDVCNAKYVDNNSNYTFKTWTNRDVQVSTQTGYNTDNLSGFWRFEKWYRDNDNSVKLDNVAASSNDSTVGFHKVSGTTTEIDGDNKIKFRGCDNAGNCSDYGTEYSVYIDKTPPTYGWNDAADDKVINSKVTNNNSSFDNDYTGGWVGLINGNGGDNGSAINKVQLSTKCADAPKNGTGSNSGCTISQQTAVYSTEINTTKAGVKVTPDDSGVSNHITGSQTIQNFAFSDNAGNKVDVPETNTVKIDYHKPVCTVTAYKNTDSNPNSTSTKYTGNWLKIGEFVTIKSTCTDDKGRINSACTKTTFNSATYNPDSGKYISTTTGGAVSDKDSGTVVDNAGNYTVCPASISVNVDHEPPTCNQYADHTDWTNKDVTVYAKCDSDTGSGCNSSMDLSKKYSSEMNSDNVSAGGIGTNVTISDKAGNTSTCTNVTVKIDKTAPTCEVIGSSDTWFNTNRTITTKCSGDNGTYQSGCNGEQLSSRTYPVNTDTYYGVSKYDGNVAIVYDKAGNPATCIYGSVHTENYTPTLTSCSINSSRQIVAEGGADTGGSGFSKYQYQFTQSDSEPSSFSDSNTSGATTACGKTNYGWAVAFDKAGNRSAVMRCGSYSISCTTTEYLCKNDCGHGTSAWYDGYSWTSTRTVPFDGTYDPIVLGYNNYIKFNPSNDVDDRHKISGYEKSTGNPNGRYIWKGCTNPYKDGGDCSSACRG